MPNLLEKLRAGIGRDHIEIGEGRTQGDRVVTDAADRLLGVCGEADHEPGHRADAELAAIGNKGMLTVRVDRPPEVTL